MKKYKAGMLGLIKGNYKVNVKYYNSTLETYIVKYLCKVHSYGATCINLELKYYQYANYLTYAQ